MTHNCARTPRFRHFYFDQGSRKKFGEEILSRSISTSRPHSGKSYSGGVTYRQYIEFIEAFVRSRWPQILDEICRRSDAQPGHVSEIDIIAEKSGSDYHPASIRVTVDGKTFSFVANVAITERGRSRLRQDFDLLDYFHQTGKGTFIPKPFWISDEAEFRNAEKDDSLVLFVGEWFDNFHEFHLTRLPNEAELSVVVWDVENGLKLLSELDSIEIYRQVAYILTHYLDLKNFCEIFPWHHAAGDFVVRISPRIEVRLITIRQYVPRIQSENDFELDPGEAALLFFCNLTIRNRVDRLDGVGAMVWAPKRFLESTVRGFFDSLRFREQSGNLESGFTEKLRSICGKLDLVAWTQLFEGTVASFSPSAPDFDIIETNLPEHIFEVYMLFRQP